MPKLDLEWQPYAILGRDVAWITFGGGTDATRLVLTAIGVDSGPRGESLWPRSCIGRSAPETSWLTQQEPSLTHRRRACRAWGAAQASIIYNGGIVSFERPDSRTPNPSRW